MIQEDPYKVKFATLLPWAAEIFLTIKKEIKGEYLRQHTQFSLKYFQKRALDKLSMEEISAACIQEINAGNEEFSEWIVTRWVMKHAELYQFFATELTKIDPQFDQIEMIPADTAEQLLRFALHQFGPKKTYIFSVMNSVQFAPETYEKLRAAAVSDVPVAVIEEKVEETVDELKKRYEGVIQKMTEKYEKRLQGQEKKYFQDMEGMKKQIGQLHKRFGELTSAIR